MSNWLCLKNNVVLNIIDAKASYLEDNPELVGKYDSFVNADALEQPPVRIGDTLVNGVFVSTVKPVVQKDYKGQVLGVMDFKYCDLEGCDFAGADISDCNFSGAKGNFNLIGAVWKGIPITHGPVFIPNKFYYCFATNAFTVMGCHTIATEHVPKMDAAEVSGSDPKFPNQPATFWTEIKDTYLALVASWK